MSLPAFVTVNGFQFRGTTAFSRGWVDEDGEPIELAASEPYPAGLADSILDLLLAAVTDSDATRDITADSDTTALEAALSKLGREKLTYIAPLADSAVPFADLTAAANAHNALNAKLTALLAQLVAKLYMPAS